MCCELDSMSELSGFVYIKSHVTLHVKSKAQKVNCLEIPNFSSSVEKHQNISLVRYAEKNFVSLHSHVISSTSEVTVTQFSFEYLLFYFLTILCYETIALRWNGS